jgi:hypothetical protein
VVLTSVQDSLQIRPFISGRDPEKTTAERYSGEKDWRVEFVSTCPDSIVAE